MITAENVGEYNYGSNAPLGSMVKGTRPADRVGVSPPYITAEAENG